MQGLNTNIQAFKDSPLFSTFLPKFTKDQSQNYGQDKKTEHYNASSCLPLDASFEFDQFFNTHVFTSGLTDNGKTLAIFEQDDKGNLNMHKYCYHKGQIESLHSRHFNTWLIRDYDYLVSHDGSFVVVFNSEELAHERDHRRRRKRGYGLGEKVYISLLVYDHDFENVRSAMGKFFPNSFVLTMSDKDDSLFWKYKHGYAIGVDGTIIVSSWGVTRDTLDEQDTGGTALYLNYFKVQQTISKIAVKHCGCTDLSGALTGKPLPTAFNDPAIVCNQNLTKVFFLSHNMVYNLITHSMSTLSEQAFQHNTWVIHRRYGEILITIDRPTFSLLNVKIFKENDQGEYDLVNKFKTSRIMRPNDNFMEEPTMHCHGINNGETRLFVEPTQSSRTIFAVNPFTLNIDFILGIPSKLEEPFVRKVLQSGDEITVLVTSNSAEYLVSYNINKCTELKSLKELSALVVLRNFSMDDILQYNIPKLLKTYLENNIFYL